MNIICKIWKHDWQFDGGHWVLPKQYATIKRSCKRKGCGLHQEIGQDHVNHLQILDKEYYKPTPKAVKNGGME